MVTDTSTVEIRSVGFLFGMRALMPKANLVWVSPSTILQPKLVKNVVTENEGLVEVAT
jgi:hypothetical protein